MQLLVKSIATSAKILSCLLLLIVCINKVSLAQVKRPSMAFTVSMPNPSDHLYHVTLNCSAHDKATLDFRMSAWTPGFYEIVDFANAVRDFHVSGSGTDSLHWEKLAGNVWRVHNPGKGALTIKYKVKAEVPFIGNTNLNEDYAFMLPGALLLYLNEALHQPVDVKVEPYSHWPSNVETGLNKVPGSANTFHAASFDELFDSPLLAGKLETLPSFSVEGRPVQFTGYNLGDFDRAKFIQGLKKMVVSATKMMRDVPYTHYSFLAVGNRGGGFGGIEHLNSVAIIMGNKGLNDTGRMHAFYSFLAHEYFHLYNVKRIRPIELGPFDYSKENYTDLLWVSEGFTDYYEYLIAKDAGLVNSSYVLEQYGQHIKNYENLPGHLYQSATQASRDIWAIGGNPSNRTNDELNRTISVYDKGCVLGLMMDLKIRHETKNRHSLDDVMRALYHDYYQVKKRGFTGKEFQQECEHVAGVKLTELFSYAATTTPVNYPAYFAYAGLAIDTAIHEQPANDLGILAGARDSMVLVRSIDWHSPAWTGNLQVGDQVLTVNGQKATTDMFNSPLTDQHEGDTVHLTIIRNSQQQQLTLTPAPWGTKTFAITRIPHPTNLQNVIYNSWLRNKIANN
jgi:predicted metalloprotease with PDZ domain